MNANPTKSGSTSLKNQKTNKRKKEMEISMFKMAKICCEKTTTKKQNNKNNKKTTKKQQKTRVPRAKNRREK